MSNTTSAGNRAPAGTSRTVDATARAVVVAIVAIVAMVALAGCSDDGPPAASASQPLPSPTSAPTTVLPVVTTPDGAPEVVRFVVPDRFWCLVDDPSEAQVTVGWHVPSATEVEVLLDGVAVPAGFQPALPYQLPAGGPTGIGATVVFPCEDGDQHSVTVRWRSGTSPTAERTGTIAKGATP
jgi:hypothetical protein